MVQNKILKKYSLIVTVLLSQCSYLTNSFVIGKEISESQSSHRSSSSLRATIRFEGDAESDVLIRFPEDGNGDSLLEWLKSSESDEAVLGTDKFEDRGDGSWDCFQPPVSWFGLELNPVFVHRIDRSAKDKVKVNIVETRTDFSNVKDSSSVIRQLMENCSFSGSNTFTIQRNAKSWSLSSDLKLTLSIPLPPFLPLPPGFNSIGSKIISRTCKTRVRENLESVKNSYLDWVATKAIKSK